MMCYDISLYGQFLPHFLHLSLLLNTSQGSNRSGKVRKSRLVDTRPFLNSPEAEIKTTKNVTIAHLMMGLDVLKSWVLTSKPFFLSRLLASVQGYHYGHNYSIFVRKTDSWRTKTVVCISRRDHLSDISTNPAEVQLTSPGPCLSVGNVTLQSKDTPSFLGLLSMNETQSESREY